MLRTRVKICGLVDADKAAYACEIGADAIGLVFYPPSPRNVAPGQAAVVAAAVAPFVTRVALFMNPEAEWVREVIGTVRIDCLQFHGAEPADFCASFGLPYLKSVPMAQTLDLAAFADRYADAQGLLLDSNAAGEAGGSGKVFDWSQTLARVSLPLILAGGLTPDNVGQGMAALNPYAVDVSSGVERSKGVKDRRLMRSFVEQVRRADAVRLGSLETE